MTPLFLLALLSVPASALDWRESFASALEESKASGKPLLIDFQAPWCYSCYYMDKHVLSGEAFARAAEKLVLLKTDVDTEEGHKLKDDFRVSFLPTYVLLSPGGKAGRIIGEQTEQDFLGRLDVLLKEGAPDPLAREVESLRARLAENDYGRATVEIEMLPKATRKGLRGRKDWNILETRLSLMKAVRAEKKKGVEDLKTLLALEDSCQLAYDADYAEKLVDSLKKKARAEALEAERAALEKLVESRFFVPAGKRCADFRTGIEVLAGVYEKLGEKDKRASLLSKTVGFLDEMNLKTGEDRNYDDNLRFFLELAGNEERLKKHYEGLVEAYPADYVYAYRYAKHLLEQMKAQEALPWVEKADKLAYGANRLSVTKVRAKILAALARREEALALLDRDVKAGQASFPKEADQLRSLREEIGKAH